VRAKTTGPHPRAQELLRDLSAEQREAVTAPAGPLLIVAGPGSGKTRVLAHQIAYAIATGRVRPGQVVAISFTNRAAGELAQRISALVGEEVGRGIEVGTFHAVCHRMVRARAGLIGRSGAFSIWDAQDNRRAIGQAVRQLGTEGVEPAAVQREISLAKARLDPVPLSADGSADPEREAFAAVWRGYEQLLARSDALDFDDLIGRAAALLGDQPDVRAQLQRRHRLVLVDEYQDTNRAQAEWLRLLAGERGDVTVVADDDQAIYGWRGAALGNVLDFEHAFPGARVVELGRNYRSSGRIVAASARLIAHSRQRRAKRLWTPAQPGPAIELVAFGDEREEASAAGAWCAALIGEGTEPGEIALLYRTRQQAGPLEQAMVAARLSYRVLGGRALFDHTEVRDALAYLRLLVNPRDRIAFTRALSAPPRGLGPASAAWLSEHAAMVHGGDLIASLRDAQRVERLRETQRSAAVGLGTALAKIAADIPTQGVGATVTETILASGLARALQRQHGREAERKLARLRALVRAARDYQADGEQPSLAGFLAGTALSGATEPEGEESGRLCLATIHAAKGLEFDCVRVVGLEEGTLPHHRALIYGGLEEERRLAYVAMTRAKQRLVLSWATKRGTRARTASGFIGETRS
jgi:DNA helicase-2/ATP-dependent DNA helicase PcrA